MNEYEMFAEILKSICLLLTVCGSIAIAGETTRYYIECKFQKIKEHSDDSLEENKS